MKLQIKTLNQKSLVIDIEESKTVYDLKKELSLYPDIGVKPELQKLIYAGKILIDEDKLSTYSISVKKFLVIMILKQPLEAPPKAVQPQQKKPKHSSATKTENASATETLNASATETLNTSATSSTASVCEFKTPPGPTECTTDFMISRIVAMGYPEPEVRKALRASFYNAERAIEYLIEGIPVEHSTPESESFSDAETDSSNTPLEVFRGDPMFRTLRNIVQQHPQVLDVVVQRIARTNPSLLSLINDHQQDFLNVLAAETDDDDDDMEAGEEQ